MSDGYSFVIRGDGYRLRFLEPQHTRGLASTPAPTVGGVMSMSGGRTAGRTWKEILPA
ncbi:MAG: hypothetical protein ACJAR2_002680 [Ilumatobacter sp.]|jgi:hypothetical protein